jgi:predicted nuclease of predicted toxin-antitoxin system
MRFLIDANLPRSIITALQRFGHEAEFARDIGLGAAPDEHIAAHALKNNAAILTRDLDFADIRRYPPEQYHGIVILRLPDTAVAAEIVALMERFLLEPGFLKPLVGHLAIVDADRVRFRPPLIATN